MNRSPCIATHGASLVARLNEAPVNSRVPNLYFINFDNVSTGAIPNLVIVNLVSDADLANEYQRNSCSFQNFGVKRIELKRYKLSSPSEGNTSNFANGQCDTGDTGVFFIPSECTNGYTLYAFKITDGFNGPNTDGQQSKFATGSARLEVSFAAAETKISNWSYFIKLWQARV